MADYLPEHSSNTVHPEDTMEELVNECETVWNQMQEYQNKMVLQETETLLNSEAKISLLMMRVKALSSEHNQWENRNPELVFDSPNVLLSLGKEELQNVKEDLEMLLSAVQAKNKQLEEDLEREQQWEDEQKEILHCLAGIKEEIKKQVEIASMRRSKAAALNELQSEVCTLQIHKEKLLTDFAEFLGKHFPHPEKGRKQFHEEPEVELITLHQILEVLMNKLLNTPHEPYVMITDSFWPPYIELLLRYGIARRHPEDASRIRLEAFHL